MDSTAPQTYKALVASEQNNQPPTVQDLPIPTPGRNQVLVKMAYCPLNPSDLLSLDGFYRIQAQPPYFVGLEGSGTVAAIGQDLNVSHKVGDRVHVHQAGGLREYVLVDSEQLTPVAEDLSLKEAACHIVNPATVAYMVSLAVRGGHKAAISTAASSVLGRMFIRYCKEKGVKTINTVRQDKYIEELKKEGADYVLNSEAPDFEAKLKELAEKEGATISFDAINGDFPEKLIRNQPANSTCYVYGFLNGGSLADLANARERGDGKTIRGLGYTTYIEEFKQRGELDKFYQEIHPRLKTIFKTEFEKEYSFDNILEALKDYKENGSRGKIMLKMN